MSKKPEAAAKPEAAKKDSKKDAPAPKAAAPAAKKEEPKPASKKEEPKAAAPAAKKEEPKSPPAAKKDEPKAAPAAKKEEPKAAAKPAAKKEEPKAAAPAAKPAAKQGSESAAKPAAKQGSESAAKPAAKKPEDTKKAAGKPAAPTKPAPPKPTASKTAAPTKAAATTKTAPAKTAAGLLVPEHVQKKTATQDKITASRLVSKAAKKSAGVKSRRDIFRRAEKYAKEYRTQERELIRFKRQARNAGNYYRPAEPKVMLVVRIRGINRIAPKTVKILHLLRLRQIHNAVFVKVNKATMNMLRVIEPYVTYGPPTQKTVAAMMYKRGHGKVNKQRIKLDQNSVVEKALGKFGIVCVEDLIHEIYTVGPNFKEANNFLWPFKLSSPNGGLAEKRRHYSEGGQHGNREEDINKLVKLMN